MEFTCQYCGKRLTRSGKGRQPKYCQSCRPYASAVDARSRRMQNLAAKRRSAVLHPGPAHRLKLDTVLRELERFNALRRAEGRSAVSYGRYVAMRDRYIPFDSADR